MTTQTDHHHHPVMMAHHSPNHQTDHHHHHPVMMAHHPPNHQSDHHHHHPVMMAHHPQFSLPFLSFVETTVMAHHPPNQQHIQSKLERIKAVCPEAVFVYVADTLEADDAFDVTDKFQDQTKESGKGAIETSELGNNKGLELLNYQPIDSVGSFGSSETFSFKRLTTDGVVISGRLLRDLKSPNDTSSNAVFLGAHSQDNSLSFLPKGLLDYTKGQGLVVCAPQIEVVVHGSTKGFQTHFGWNSTLESIVSYVLLIAWQLYAVQRTNAILLTCCLNTALRLVVDENGLVGREEIVNVVKETNEMEKGGRNLAIISC